MTPSVAAPGDTHPSDATGNPQMINTRSTKIQKRRNEDDITAREIPVKWTNGERERVQNGRVENKEIHSCIFSVLAILIHVILSLASAVVNVFANDGQYNRDTGRAGAE